jgi:hypothetical protein
MTQNAIPHQSSCVAFWVRAVAEALESEGLDLPALFADMARTRCIVGEETTRWRCAPAILSCISSNNLWAVGRGIIKSLRDHSIAFASALKRKGHLNAARYGSRSGEGE